MLELNQQSLEILKKFGETIPMTQEQKIRYEKIESAYGRLLTVFLYCNQSAYDKLPKQYLEDIDHTIERIYESLFWAKRSLTTNIDNSYENVQWLLISSKKDGFLSASYEVVSNKLISNCPANQFLEQALVRLLNSYNIASSVTAISQSILNATKNQHDDLRKVRKDRMLMLEPTDKGKVKHNTSLESDKNVILIDGTKIL